MRKIKLIMTIFVIIFALILSGCSQKDIENPDQTDSSDDYLEFYSPAEVYSWAKNVYEAELIDFKTDYLSQTNKQKVQIQVRITNTYKGEYYTDEYITDEVYIRGVNKYFNLSLEEFLIKNNYYLFMTGVDENYKGVERDIYQYSWCQIVPMEWSDEYLTYWNKSKTPHYIDFIHQMLDINMMEAMYNTTSFRGNPGQYETKKHIRTYWYNMNFGQFFVLSDNVYIGELLEADFPEEHRDGMAKVLVKGYDDVYCFYSMVKVRVLNVWKGEYKPGEVVIDVIPAPVEASCQTNPFICFSGDAFFEGYDELLEIARESLAEETTNE